MTSMASAARVKTSATGALVVLLAGALLDAPSARAATPTDLLVRVTGTAFRVGKYGRYTVTVSNVGKAATDADVHLTDLLPDGISFVSNTGRQWSCSASGQSVDCDLPTPLPAGRSTTFRLLVSVCTAAFPSITNTVRVVYPADTNPTNDSRTRTTLVKAGRCTPPVVTPPLATVTPSNVPGTPVPTATATATATPVPALTDVSLSKTVASTFTVGSNGTYALTVRNVGTASTADVITVTDTLPASLGYISASGANWSCAAAGQTVTCSNSTPLAPAAASSIALQVSISSAAYPSVTNTATVSYAGDTNSANNTAQRPTTIRQ